MAISLQEILQGARRVPGLFRSGIEEVREQGGDFFEELRRKREDEEKKRGMVFRTGEGISSQDKSRALENIKKSRETPEMGVLEEIIKAGPRAAAGNILSIQQEKALREGAPVPVEFAAGQDSFLEDLLGTDKKPVKSLGLAEQKESDSYQAKRAREAVRPSTIQGMGESGVADIGVENKTAQRLGGLAAMGLSVADVFDPIPTGRVGREVAEKVAKTTSARRIKNLVPEVSDEVVEQLRKVTDPDEVNTVIRSAIPDQDELRDSVLTRLRSLEAPDFQTGRKDQFEPETFGRVNEILEKAEKGEDTVTDIQDGAQILKMLDIREVPSEVKDRAGFTTKELYPDSLTQQARQFDTPEEFVEAQTNAFHGTNQVFDEFDASKIRGDVRGPGINFINDPKAAEAFGKNVIRAKVNLNNPLDLTKKLSRDEVARLNKATGMDFTGFEGQIALNRIMERFDQQDVLRRLQEAGFDGTKTIGREGREILVAFDPSQIKTQSQLTDIWKQANNQAGFANLGEGIEGARETGRQIKRGLQRLTGRGESQVDDTIETIAAKRKQLDPDNVFPGEVAQDLIQSVEAPGGLQYIDTSARKGPGYTKVTGEKTKWPDWVSESLRENKVASKVLDHIQEGTMPKAGTKAGDLFEEYQNEINRRLEIPESFSLESLSGAVKKGEQLEDSRKQNIQDLLRGVRGMEPPKVTRQSIDRAQRPLTPFVRKREATLLKDRLRNLARGAREGARMTKKEVRAVQKEAVSMIEQSGLKPKDQKKFTRAITNIQSQDQLEKKIPEIAERVERLAEEDAVRTLKTKVKKEMDGLQPKRVRGILRGKLEAETQKKVGSLQKALETPRDEAQQQILKNIEEAEGILPEEKVIENELLALADLDSQNSDQLQTTLDTIQSLKEDGMTRAEIKRFNKQTEIQRATDAIKAEVYDEARDNIIQGEKTKKDFWKKLLNSDSWIHGLDTMAEKLSSKGEMFTGPIHDFVARIHDARRLQQKGTREAFNELQTMFDEIYGTTTKRQRNAIVRRNQEAQDLGSFVNSNGQRVRLKLSQNEAYKKWMEMQDETLDETFEAMGWTDEMKQAVENSLDPATKQWAEWQLREFYPKYYDSINETYRSLYGVDMPNNPNYSPLFREGIDTEKHGIQLLIDDFKKAVGTPGSVKTRVKNTKPLKVVDGDEVLIRHITEMEHFKAMQEPLNDMRRVFGDSELRGLIENRYSKSAVKAIDKIQDNIATNGKDIANTIRLVDSLRSNFTKATLGINPAVAIKQLTSIPAYITQMPQDTGVGSYAKYTADFWRNPVKNTRTLMDSEMMKARYDLGTMERDIRLAMKKGASGKLTGKQKLTDHLMFPTRFGDRAAILQGGWPVYKSNLDHYLKAGKSRDEAHAIALKQFERATARTQQSGLPEDLSMIQTTGGSIGRLFTMFLTTPQQYLRLTTQSGSNVIKAMGGQPFRGKTSKNVRNFALLWAGLPMVFQWAADGFEFEEERQARAALVGPLNGIPMLGDAFDTIARAITGDDRFAGTGAPPPYASVDNLGAGISKLLDEGMTVEEFYEAAEKIATGAGQLSGVPVGPALQQAKGVKDIATGETDDLRRAFFSPYALDQDKPRPLLDFSQEEPQSLQDIIDAGLQSGATAEQIRGDIKGTLMSDILPQPELTGDEESLKNATVTSRARTLSREVKKSDDPEELIRNYARKGIITEDVLKEADISQKYIIAALIERGVARGYSPARMRNEIKRVIWTKTLSSPPPL